MTLTSTKNNTYIKIFFSRDRSITVDYDSELEQFLDTVKPNTSETADIRILENYFNIMWPVYIHGPHRIPHTFVKYVKGS